MGTPAVAQSTERKGDVMTERPSPQTAKTITEMDAYAARCVARKLHPSTAAKLRNWGIFDTRYIELQPSSPLRKHRFVESMGGRLMRLTDLGKIAREALSA